MVLQSGKRMGFLESGGQDVDGIMRALEDSNSFSTFAGLSSALLPALFAAYGNPVRGITAFSKKLHVERADVDSEVKAGGETFLQKLQHLRKSDPENFEKYRLETITLVGNVVAGSDTTSISLTGALYRIFTTEGVSRRLSEELSSQGEMTDEHISFDRAQQLPYLQMVIKEALRVHPVVGLPMWREINGTGLDIDGTHFPPGVSDPVPCPNVCSNKRDANSNPIHRRHQPLSRTQKPPRLRLQRHRLRAGALGSKADFSGEAGCDGRIQPVLWCGRENVYRQAHLAP
jgi:hypothetical protein